MGYCRYLWLPLTHAFLMLWERPETDWSVNCIDFMWTYYCWLNMCVASLSVQIVQEYFCMDEGSVRGYVEVICVYMWALATLSPTKRVHSANLSFEIGFGENLIASWNVYTTDAFSLQKMWYFERTGKMLGRMIFWHRTSRLTFCIPHQILCFRSMLNLSLFNQHHNLSLRWSKQNHKNSKHTGIVHMYYVTMDILHIIER